MFMSNEEIIKKRVAREILSMIETVCFSEEFREYRVNNGSNGTRIWLLKILKRHMALDEICGLSGGNR